MAIPTALVRVTILVDFKRFSTPSFPTGSKGHQDTIQKNTDKCIKEIEELGVAKEKELGIAGK